MKQTEREIAKELESFKEKSSDEKLIILESFYDHELSGAELELICDYITDADKGVRNSVAYLLINNADDTIAKKIVPYVSSPDI
jgi:hypothetical protein